MNKGTIDLDKARAERATADPEAFASETPASLMLRDPAAFREKHPEEAKRFEERVGPTLRRCMDHLVFEAPIENWEKDAHEILRRVRTERRRRGDEAAWRLFDVYRRQRSRSTSGSRSRASRTAAPRTRGSRRPGASSSTSSADPGDPDPEPSSPRVCGGCGEPLIGKAPQARFCGDACRMRARRLAAKPHRPVWTEAEVIALALAIEPFPVIAGIMEEPPGGYVPPRRRLARGWAVGPGRGRRAPIREDRMVLA